METVVAWIFFYGIRAVLATFSVAGVLSILRSPRNWVGTLCVVVPGLILIKFLIGLSLPIGILVCLSMLALGTWAVTIRRPGPKVPQAPE